MSTTDGIFTFDERDRGMQIAVDALAIRHHVAEGLVRFLYALVAAQPNGADAPCTWLAVANSPMSLAETVGKVHEAFEANSTLFQPLFFRPGMNVGPSELKAAETALAWLNHSVKLLTSNELAVNAANNKVKHGLAVSARDDVRIELVTTQPDESGNIPVSAFGEGKSIPIFDRPMLSFLSHPGNKRALGIELTALRVDVPSVLAETWMIAVTYAALFHVAALKHFDGDEATGIASYPRLPVGPLPDQILKGKVNGYRGVVTTPAEPEVNPRPTGVFFHDFFWPMNIDFGSKFTATVVDG